MRRSSSPTARCSGDAEPVSGQPAASGSSGQRRLYQAGLSVPSFELDLFGRLRSLTHVQLEHYFATEAGARSTRLTLVANVASAWLNYAADSSLLLIAEETAASAAEERPADPASARGRNRAADRPRPGEQILRQAQADLARQRTAVAQDVNALQLLVGAPIDPTLARRVDRRGVRHDRAGAGRP